MKPESFNNLDLEKNQYLEGDVVEVVTDSDVDFLNTIGEAFGAAAREAGFDEDAARMVTYSSILLKGLKFKVDRNPLLDEENSDPIRLRVEINSEQLDDLVKRTRVKESNARFRKEYDTDVMPFLLQTPILVPINKLKLSAGE